MNYVYLLKSLKDNKQYIGSTTNIKRRIREHNSGYVESTKSRRPLVLLGYQNCENIQEAGRLEKIYKGSHGALERSIKRGDFKIINGV